MCFVNFKMLYKCDLLLFGFLDILRDFFFVVFDKMSVLVMVVIYLVIIFKILIKMKINKIFLTICFI